ncbi:GNAT family N-acetyltransferase [Cohnella hashimotonis]|uniref:GNAT family N-acetyltransferase n=1 Tax=Cohnella hashimotonis TaxID=2826895 RepID=A0ABT6TUT2_9BACL|nr:GNAT family N-acetyltransferase [Cohnella hashimotonis]MDI4649958.1 GNAT family N-acetyltransferase [Cohnella hashimotonis]
MSDVHLRRLKAGDATALLELRRRNRAFFEPFEPIRADREFTPAGIRDMLDQEELHWAQGSGYGFGIFLRDREKLVGRINLSNVVRGAWESCTVGYYMDEAEGGRGLMTEALGLAVDFAFGQAGLHRIQAAVMPRNRASIRVIEKNGFQYEGLAEYYLKINGIWEHHRIYSLTREHLVRST